MTLVEAEQLLVLADRRIATGRLPLETVLREEAGDYQAILRRPEDGTEWPVMDEADLDHTIGLLVSPVCGQYAYSNNLGWCPRGH
jgi:hypothetical protein